MSASPQIDDEVARMLRWAAGVYPDLDLRSVIDDFEIPASQVWRLAGAILNSTGKGVLRKNSVDASRKRYIEDNSIYKKMLECIEFGADEMRFIRSEKGLEVDYDISSQYPDGYFDPHKDDAYPAALLGEMVQALIRRNEKFVADLETDASDLRAMGNNVNYRRHVYWFSLLIFWHHELGRPIAASVDPITGEPSGPLIRFFSAMSHSVIEPEPSAHAIRSFVRSNKKRAIEDPEFGSRPSITF